MNQSKQIKACFQLTYADPTGDPFTLDMDVMIPGRGITAVFGRSGSGKTTLLRCIAGLEKAERGELIVNGETWQDATRFVPTHRRSLGYVFQESSLFPHLTAKQNLDYAVKRARSTAAAGMVDRIVDIMGIQAMLQRRPAQLSGGERQRVAIARALLMQPRLLLMDEPLASLDVARKQEILPYLTRLHASFEIPILYVSHALEEVARLADHVLLLEQGRLAARGNPTEVFSRLDLPMPLGEDRGVILEGEIIEQRERWHLACFAFSGGRLWVRDDGEQPGQPVRVRVMAGDVSLALSRHEDTSILNRLPVTISQIAASPDPSVALVRLEAGADHLLARITHRSRELLALEPGKRVWAQIKSAAIVR